MADASNRACVAKSVARVGKEPPVERREARVSSPETRHVSPDVEMFGCAARRSIPSPF